MSRTYYGLQMKWFLGAIALICKAITHEFHSYRRVITKVYIRVKMICCLGHSNLKFVLC